MKYDIFISYRRVGGYETAKHLNDLLVRDKYRVSFDIDTLRSGDFDLQLLERIDQCKDFILIVDEHAFDRTLDPDFDPKHDWLRCELQYALKQNKNIIPVFLSGVDGFPNNLPDDIKAVTKKNGPEYNKYYFNDFYERLCNDFLISKPIKYYFKLYGSIAFILSVLAVGLSFYLNSNTEEEKIVKYIDPSSHHYTIESEFVLYAKTTIDKYIENNNWKESDIPQKLIDRAKDGDEESQLMLGLAYVSAYNVEQNYSKAVEWLEKSANQENIQSQYSLGVCYNNGLGVEEDKNTASKYFEKSALKGFAPSQYDYAFCNQGLTRNECFKYLKESAAQGYAPAQYALSRLYANGYFCSADVMANFKESVYWCNLAIKQNYIWAKLWLGYSYCFAPEEERDVDKGIEILEKLSEEGLSYAQLQLASLYYMGIQGEDIIDKTKAFDLYDRASKKGNPCAQYFMGFFYMIGENELNGRKVDYDKAFEYFKESSQQGFAYAYYQIAQMYKKGFGVEKNLEEAQKWEQKAKDAGYMEQQQYQQQQQQQQR